MSWDASHAAALDPEALAHHPHTAEGTFAEWSAAYPRQLMAGDSGMTG